MNVDAAYPTGSCRLVFFAATADLDVEREVTEVAPVSVVIPCYRCSATIGKAISSVVAQTLRPAEILLVDDFSDDGTLAELERQRMAFGVNWIRVIALPRNLGAGGARNAGWDLATQPLVAFLDADDIWLPAKLSLQCRWMLETQAAAVSAHTRLPVWVDGGETPVTSGPHWKQVSPSQLIWRNAIATSSVMLRRDLPFRFDPQRRLSEDYWLWLQIAFAGHEIYVCDLALARSHRPDFSGGGLSGRLWEMERAELSNFLLLRSQEKIGSLKFLAACGWSIARYGRRVATSAVRRYRAR